MRYKMTRELFSEDYYENGVEKKISGYSNYKYIPTRSYEEASTLKERWKEGNVLDYGCAKGYLVHTLCQLGLDAYGFDISKYAVENAHERVKDKILTNLFNTEFDYIICKDVMEHIPEDNIPIILKELNNILIDEALFVIPLGDNDKFRIREYEIDVTHVTKKDEDWWIDKFKEAGFEIVDFKYKFGDIKKKWQNYDYGNGFFFVRPK